MPIVLYTALSPTRGVKLLVRHGKTFIIESKLAFVLPPNAGKTKDIPSGRVF